MNNINIIIFNSDIVPLDLINLIFLLAVFFGIYVIISNNPVLSVLFLIGLFFSIAIYLILLGLHFIGLSYLLVYVGAISMLFLFILMLINIRVSELFTDNRNSLLLAVLTVFFFNFSIGDSLPQDTYSYNLYNNFIFTYILNMSDQLLSFQFAAIAYDYSTSLHKYLLFSNVFDVADKSWDSSVVTTTHISCLGNILYTNLFILSIVMSIILLLAMVGAIIITINNKSSKNVLSTPDLPKFTTTRLQSGPIIPEVPEMSELLATADMNVMFGERLPYLQSVYGTDTTELGAKLSLEYGSCSKSLFKQIDAFKYILKSWRDMICANNVDVIQLGKPGNLDKIEIWKDGELLKKGDHTFVSGYDKNHLPVSKDLFDGVSEQTRKVQVRFDAIHKRLPEHDQLFIDMATYKRTMNHPESELQAMSRKHLSANFSNRANLYKFAEEVLGSGSKYPKVYPNGTQV